MSRGDLLVLVAVLAGFGIADSGYLVWQWYEAAGASWCDFGDFFSCSRVRESPYAAVAGIPTAWAGVIGFMILLVLAFLAFRGIGRLGPWAVDRWLFAIAVLGALAGLALTAIEVFVIESLCMLCLAGFLLDLGVLGVSVALLRRGS